MEKKSYKEVIGERLKSFRLSRHLTAYAVAKKGGIKISQVNAVEEGVTNYTIDIFLGYLVGCELPAPDFTAIVSEALRQE